MITMIKKYVSGDMFITLMVTAGTLIGAFFSYLLHVMLGRFLSVSDYGTFNALLAITNLAGVPIAVLSTSVLKKVSELTGKEDKDTISAFLSSNIKIILGLSIFVIFIFLLFNPFLSQDLKLGNNVLIFVFSLSFAASLFSIIPLTYTQGMLRFGKYSLLVSIFGFIRFFIPITMIYLGFGLIGLYNGMFLSHMFTLFYGMYLLKDLLNLGVTKSINLDGIYRDVLVASIPIFFIQISLSSLINSDMIVVKRTFDEVSSGYYSGAVVLGKIFLFGASTVTAVMFPKISKLHSSGAKYTKVFRKFVLLQLFITTAGLAFYQIFPQYITRIFFGTRFDNSVIILGYYSFFISIYVLINFLSQYFLAIGKYQVGVILVIAAIIHFVLLNLFPHNIYYVLGYNISVGASLLVALVLYYFALRSKQTV